MEVFINTASGRTLPLANYKALKLSIKNIIHKFPLMTPEMTFNDLEGKKYIAYDSSLYTMSMHAKNQVNRCSG